MTGNDILITIVVSCLSILVVLSLVVALLVISSNRQNRHRAELASAELQRERDVMKAEREAVQHTLHEVGMELHDNVAQLLSTTQFGLSTALNEDPRNGFVNSAYASVLQALGEVRRLSHTLSTDMWRNRTLDEAIGIEALRLQRLGNMPVHVDVIGTLPVLSIEVNTALYRVFQEVVNNAIKHSGADRLEVTLSAMPLFNLTIADNGKGFDPLTNRSGNGMANITRRCDNIAFRAVCTSNPGQGCKWRFQELPASA